MEIQYANQILKQTLVSRTVLCLVISILYLTIVYLLNETNHPPFLWILALSLGFLIVLVYLFIPSAIDYRLGKSITITDQSITLPSILSPRTGKRVPMEQIISKELRGDGRNQILKISYYGGAYYFIASQLSNPELLNKLYDRIKVNTDLTNEFKKPLTSQTLVVIIFISSMFFLSKNSLTPIMDLLALGAWEPNAIQNGRPDRSISYLFLHLTYLHLATNLLGLLFLGFALEHRVKPHHFLAIFFGGGIFATSGFYFGSFTFMVGASGGIYALFGAYLTDRFVHPSPKIERFKGTTNKLLFLIIFLDVCSALSITQVALGVHALGFLFGTTYIFIIRKTGMATLAFTITTTIVLPLVLLSVYSVITISKSERHSFVRQWMEQPYPSDEFQVAIWNIAVSELSTPTDFRIAIDELSNHILTPEHKDTLATLHARNSELDRAIEIENGLIETKVVYGSQLARFERAYTKNNPLDIQAFAESETIAIDAICNNKEFVRVHTNETDKIPNICTNQEIIYIREAEAGSKNIRYELDPKFMALPL